MTQLCLNLQIDRFPFDSKNPVGFSVAVVLQIIIIGYPLRFLACYASLALGAYMFAIAFVKDILDDLKSLNDNLKATSPESDVYKKLCEVIHVHSGGKQLNTIS